MEAVRQVAADAVDLSWLFNVIGEMHAASGPPRRPVMPTSRFERLYCGANKPAGTAASSQILESSRIMTANSAGELAITSSPFSPSTGTDSGAFRMRTISALYLAVIAAGRSGGPRNPTQARPGWKLGRTSAIVGTSGAL